MLGAAYAGNDRAEVDAARGVGLRVEEHLDVHDVLGRNAPEVRHCEVIEVVLGEQNGHAFVVLHEERRKITKVVGGPHLVNGVVGKVHVVAGSKLELQSRLQRALDMQVELGLGKRVDEFLDRVHVVLRHRDLTS